MNSESWQTALEKTRRTTFGRIASLLGQTELTAEFWEELEAELILSDLGVNTSQHIIAALMQQVRERGWTQGKQLRAGLRSLLIEFFNGGQPEPFSAKPCVILIVGVNGSGKTTSLVKLASHLRRNGKSILLTGADTYRAAAIEQLQLWAERLDMDVISGQPASDPGAVVYDACHAATARGVDVVLIDTSGRMHTEQNLMSELEKIARVAGKVIEDAPHQTYLVIDAATGQNGLSQAEMFKQAVNIDGIILAKLDGSAKGGIAVAIQQQLGIPVCFVGLGEGLDEFSPFDAQAYVDGLIGQTSN